jgi:hypothetical protein
VPTRLNTTETNARKLLIEVAKGAINTRIPGRIGYQVFWERIFRDKKWERGKTKTIIRIITQVSGYELQNGRPPLNELVVRVSGDNKGKPGCD